MQSAHRAVNERPLAPQLGRGLAQTVAKWWQHGLVHRDLSPSNVGLTSDGAALIWDLYTMTSVPMGLEELFHFIGTPLYMVISVQRGAQPTLSSELESILYILIALSSVDGVVHWQRSQPRDTDAKVAAMLNADTFLKKVRMRRSLHSCSGMMTCCWRQATHGCLVSTQAHANTTQTGSSCQR